MPYWEDLEYNDPDEIDGPDDVTLPVTMHHMQARTELDLLVRGDVIDDDEAMRVMREWRARQEMSDDSRLRSAVDELAARDLIDEERAEGIKERIPA